MPPDLKVPQISLLGPSGRASSAPKTQYIFRALKSVGIVNGHPAFSLVETFQQPDGNVRAFSYSPDGRRYAIAASNEVRVYDAENGELLVQLDLPNVIETAFSPKGTWISTWERYAKPADESAQHKNMRVWDVVSGREVISFSQKSIEGWSLQFTDNESHALRLVSAELHVYDPTAFQAGVTSKLRLEGMSDYKLSTGRNPHVAAFVAEKKGAPASVKIYPLLNLANSAPVSQKTFYKADKIQIKWNKSGTSVLLLTQTDVDKTGKSYYGETNLYMLTANGTFDCRVTLDREGGIHDFVWSPNDKEFAVSYGYMPAKTTIFDHRSNVIHDFGTAPRNFIAYNPQGRLLLSAGFGNLAGTMDVWDRRTLKKVVSIEASNTSHCEWSPDGRYIMCATLSPRLRVDNGVRIFHYAGSLMHVDSMENLYSASWRPASAELFPFRQALSPPPTPIGTAGASAPVTPIKSAGAYRPPHARGTTTPSHFKREDEGGAPYVAPTNGAVNGVSKVRSGGGLPPGAAPARRTGVPGAAPNKPNLNGTVVSKSKKKTSAPHDSSRPAHFTNPAPEPVAPAPVIDSDKPTSALAADGLNSHVPLGQLSPEDKKRRALMKKLTAIEQLKERRKRGEKLEMTQVKKIESEAETRKELEAMG
ncbi:hypothetical protein CROQUDRAFT_664447 [Cronartium quercuum f. sp. fusiforme G11]|uniref:Eukaryotic translation initiation factor 2A n=1 Tax=Cronartium quercuum f. sp. fusiforme G11 TaxID=708437 RepID=A0A9P6T6M0_9BASI|nr:hypothetical protein CROQUDRAFT_664447 [Cronartium quercuum f. sp. fusiforme G11]